MEAALIFRIYVMWSPYATHVAYPKIMMAAENTVIFPDMEKNEFFQIKFKYLVKCTLLDDQISNREENIDTTA